MPQTETIDNLVNPKAFDEVDKLVQKVNEADAAFIAAISNAQLFTDTLAGSKGAAAFNANNQKAAASIDRVVAASDRARLAEINLQRAREKAFDDYNKKLAQQEAATKRTASAESKALYDSTDQRKQLTLALQDQEVKYANLYLTQGKNAAATLEAKKGVLETRAVLDDLNNGIGRYGTNVGNYSSAFTGYANTLRGLRGPTKLLGEALGLGAQEADQFRLILEHSFQGIAAFFRGKEAKAAASAEAAVTTAAETAAETAQTAAQNTNTVSTEANTVATEGAAIAETELAVATTGASVAMNVFRIALLATGIGVVIGLIALAVISFKNQAKAAEEAKRANDELGKGLESTDYKNAIENVSTLTENIKLAQGGFLDKTKVLKEYNDTIGKTTGQIKTLDDAETALVKNGPAYIRLMLLKAAAQESLKESGKKLIEAEQAQLDPVKNLSFFQKLNLPFENAPSRKNQEQSFIKPKVDKLKKDAADYETIANKFQQQAAELAKKNNFDFFSGTEDPDKGKKKKKIADISGKDLTAGFNEALDAEKKKNELVQQNDQSSYDKRLQSVDEFQKKSIELINQRTIEELKNNKLTAQQKTNIAQKGENDVTGIELEAQKERQVIADKIQKEIVASFKEGIKQQSDAENEAVNILKEASTARNSQISNDKDDAITALDGQYSKQLISLEDYNQKKSDIEHAAAQETLRNEIAAQTAILAIQQEAAYFDPDKYKDVVSSEKALHDLQVKLAKDEADQRIANNKRATDDRIKAIDYTAKAEQELQKFVVAIVSARFTKELNQLKKQSTAIDEKTKSQIDAENRSLDSAQVKADKIAVINAQAAAQKQVLTNKENQIKTKQAKIDKLAAIATAIEQGALATLHGLFEGGPLLAAAYATIAGLQIAAIIATPVPQYFTGTPSSKAGPAWVGERGMELAIEPGGKKWLTPEVPTLMNLTGGTKIINNKELMQSMARPPQFQNIAHDIDIKELILEQRANNRELKAVKEAILAGQRQPPRRGLNYNDSRFNTYYQGLKQ